MGSKVDRPGRKPAWREERMELDFRKKNRRDRMMRLNSFETQDEREREAGRKQPCQEVFPSYGWE